MPQGFEVWGSQELLDSVMELLESPFFDEAKALVAPVMAQQPLFLLLLLLAAGDMTYMRRFLLEQLLLRVLCQPLVAETTPFLQNAVRSHAELAVELVDTFMRSHEVPGTLLLNVNALGLQEALLDSESHLVFNHVFVKNFTRERQEALEPVLVARVKRFGGVVLSSMLEFLVEHVGELEGACRPVLALLQYLEELQFSQRLGDGPAGDIAGTLRTLCEKSPAMKTVWEESVAQKAEQMLQELLENPRSGEALSEYVRKLRGSRYFFDREVYQAFLRRILDALSEATKAAETDGDSSQAVRIADIVVALFVQRALEEEEHDTLERLAEILKQIAPLSVGNLLLQRILPPIQPVIRDHHDIEILLKGLYAHLTVTPSPVMPLSEVAPGLTPRSSLPLGPYVEPHLPSSPLTQRREGVETSLFSEFENCPPLDEATVSSIKRIMNQLGSNNIKPITERLFALLQPAQYPSFARFFVDSYIARQNFLDVYLKIVLSKHEEKWEEYMLDAAIMMAYELVRQPDAKAETLRHLGTFVGGLTLQRDRVLPRRKLNLSLLLDNGVRDGYVKNAIIFATFLMRTCVKSKVLGNPQQPWVHAILLKLVWIDENPAIANKSMFVSNMLDVFGIKDQALVDLKREAMATSAGLAASPSGSFLQASAFSLQSVPSSLQHTLSQSSVPAVSQLSGQMSGQMTGQMTGQLGKASLSPMTAPGMTPTAPGLSSKPSTPVVTMGLPNNAYLRTPPIQPLSPPLGKSETPGSPSAGVNYFMDHFLHMLPPVLSSQPFIQQTALTQYMQMQGELNMLVRRLVATLPEGRDRIVPIEEMLKPQIEKLRQAFAPGVPSEGDLAIIHAFVVTVKEMVLQQVDVALKGSDSVLGTINEANTGWSQPADSYSLGDHLVQVVGRATANVVYHLKMGFTLSSSAIQNVRHRLCTDLSQVLATQVAFKADSSDPRYCFLIDLLSRLFIDSMDSLPRQALVLPILTAYKNTLAVKPASVVEFVLQGCLEKKDLRLNVLFIGRLVKEQLLSVETLDKLFAKALEAPAESLERSVVVPAMSTLIQQLMLGRHQLYSNQLPESIRRAVEVSSGATEETPRLQELRQTLLRLQQRYEVLVQETAYLSKFAGVLRAWLNLYTAENNAPGEEVTMAFILALKKKDLLQSETQTVVALRLLLLAALDMASENAVPSTVASEVQSVPPSFTAVDGFAALALALFKFTEAASRPSLLLCVLTSIASVLTEEQKAGSTRALTPGLMLFSQLQAGLLEPLLPLLLEASSNDTSRAALHAQATDLTRVFLHGLQLTQPATLPTFSYAWAACLSATPLIQLVKTLNDATASRQYRDLLFAYVRFLHGFMLLDATSEVLERHFKALTTLLLALHAMWPDLLARNYGDLCLLIPLRFLQMHNIICSATPAGIVTLSPREPMTDRMMKVLNEPTRDAWDTRRILAGLGLEEKLAAFRNTGNNGIAAELGKRLPTLTSPEMMFALLYEVAAGTYLRNPVEERGGKVFPVEFYLQALRHVKPSLAANLMMSLLDHIRYPAFDTYTFCMLMKTLIGNGDVNEIVFTCICDRMLVPGPKPWGLEFLFSQLVNGNADTIHKLNCYTSNPKVVELVSEYYSSK